MARGGVRKGKLFESVHVWQENESSEAPIYVSVRVGVPNII